MSIVYLKIKIKSLAEEARIIRKEEEKYKQKRAFYWARGDNKYNAADTIFWALRDHRATPVGTESRAALLAYGYLRGRKFQQLETAPKKEGKAWRMPQWNRVIDLVCKYGTEKDRDAVVNSLRDWSGLPELYKTRYIK